MFWDGLPVGKPFFMNINKRDDMLRIAVQSKGRLFEETSTMLAESSIKVDGGKRTLLVKAKNFPVEILYLRDDDIPQAVASGIADVGIVGENEYEERQEDAEVIRPLGFSKCRLSLAIPKSVEYIGDEAFKKCEKLNQTS